MLISKQTNINQEKVEYKYAKYKNTITGNRNKLKMKWNIIKWIIDNKKGN